MKIETNEKGEIVLKEVFSGVGMETEEGNRIGVCMRDDTFEISVWPKGHKKHTWFRVNMQKVEIEKEICGLESFGDATDGGE